MKYCNILPLLAGCMLVASSCNGSKNTGVEPEKDLRMESLAIDTVCVDSIELCSYTGFSGTYGNSLYFFDEQLCYLYPVSLDGKVGKRRLGMGHSAWEVPITRPSGVSYSEESGRLIMLGGSYDAYIYDEKNGVERIDMQVRGDKTSYASSSAYTLWDEVVMRNDASAFYYNVFGNNEAVDIFHQKDHFKNTAILMRVDVKDGTMTPIGKYSDYYVENKDKIKHLPYYYFDVAEEGGFYVTYQADSLIYQYDADFHLVHSFGFQGSGMNTDYSNPGTTYEEFAEAVGKDMQNAGYYYWIEHVGDYTFRSYRKSGTAATDGLQIYQDRTLIADVDVPHGFRVVGAVDGYFVTQIKIDEENRKLQFYKFKIED